MAKALPDIAEQYEQHLVDPTLHELGVTLRARYQKAVDGLLTLTSRDTLLAHNPTLARSISLRNPYVDPLNILQVELLRRLRQENLNDDEKKQISDALKITVNGIAHGMRNTG